MEGCSAHTQGNVATFPYRFANSTGGIANQDGTAVLAPTAAGFIVQGTVITKALASDTTAPTVGFSVITALADADATLTVTQLRGQRITMAVGANNRTVTLPTAALIVAAYPGLVVGSEIPFSVTNLKAANTCTVAVGTGITAPTGVTLQLAQTTARSYVLVATNVTSGAEAFTLLNVGS